MGTIVKACLVTSDSMTTVAIGRLAINIRMASFANISGKYVVGEVHTNALSKASGR